MRSRVRFPLATLAASLLTLCLVAASAVAQTKPSAAGRQLALSEKQIQSVISAQKDFEALGDQPSGAVPGKPAPNMVARMDEVSKKHGFANYADYVVILDNIGLVLRGFDPKSKTYVGPEAALKQQIAAVQADKAMSADDKKEALDELNQGLKSLPPPVENKGNIPLVAKYYDQLNAVMKANE